MTISLHSTSSFARIIAFMAAILWALTASAFAPDFYTSESVLSKGTWVKISVEESGLHLISTANLRAWGFSDPAKVRIHGYGGRCIPNTLSEADFIDDLPEVASELTPSGLVFYAAGPDTWVKSTGEYYHREFSIYSSRGYYFLTESEDPPVSMPLTGVGGGADPATTAQGRAHYEKELTLMSESGTLFVGEDLRQQNKRYFTVSTPGRVEGSTVWLETQVVHSHTGATARLEQTVGSETFSDNVPATTDSHYVHGSLVCARHTCTPPAGETVGIDITYTPRRNVYTAYLDYISANYTIDLTMGSPLATTFWSSSPRLRFSAGEELRIWDVTSPSKIEKVDATFDGTAHTWSVSRTGMREYVAWMPGAHMPAPSFAGRVANQNLHAHDTDGADMIIFAPSVYASVGHSLARLHAATDGLVVKVVDPQEVYNEFSSGAPDISGLRKYLKMSYDRGASSGRPLRYALLLGRASLDNRAIMASTRAMGNATLPAWGATTAREALTDNDGLLTDDFIAMLGDNSGADLGLDDLSIAVGRIPLLSVAEGEALVAKLENYINRSTHSGWKNRLLILADDEDQGVHLRQAEAMVKNMEATPGQQHTFTKVYIDAYERSGGTVPEARQLMFDALEDGVAWWIFTGHANNHSWTGEGILTYTDINSMYLRQLPVVLAATCDFLRWDSETISGGEIMYKEPNGGAIAMISATRPVYITDNAYFVASFGRHALERDSDGRLLTAGEIYRRSKNDILNSRGEHASAPNRLRFVFMGDPAMPLSTPHNVIEVTAINGEAADGSCQPTVAAMQHAKVEGRVNAPDGTLLNDFNGVVTIEIYDALQSVTTLANGNGKEEIFDTMGDKLQIGSAKVENGRFTARIPMPAMVADNFREATMSLYAHDSASGAEAVGANRNFYVFGYEEPDDTDHEAPVIVSMVLNHEGFTDGATVHSTPMLIASISDNVGINLSTTGVGHRMTVTLDDFTTFSDVASSFTPAADGSSAGTLRYSLPAMADGPHSLRLRVFDTSGNYAEKQLSFNVEAALAPTIFEVYTDANPATTCANFFVRHDRPEDIVEVAVGVYDLLGRPVWSSKVKGLSDMNVSPSVAWDLNDASGRRVGRGIYLYRATVTTATGVQSTATRRLAVTAP